jgi:hypothetical protein
MRSVKKFWLASGQTKGIGNLRGHPEEPEAGIVRKASLARQT